jgi:uncharacterized protein
VPAEPAEVVRRRRAVVLVTLIAGTTLLATTLRVPRGSGWFTLVGLTMAATWTCGAFASGPIPLRAGHPRPWRGLAAPAMAVGGVAFLGFLVASEIGQRLPVVSGALERVLATADAGSLAVVLVVALTNGVAEELFFRGALHDAFPRRRAGLYSTIVYVLVTAATGNISLVVAAVVMGAVFSLERSSTRGVLAPIVTHLSWSTLMLLALPR